MDLQRSTTLQEHASLADQVHNACPVHHKIMTYLVLDRKVDEIGIHQDMVRRPKLRVILEEKGCGHLLPVALNTKLRTQASFNSWLLALFIQYADGKT